MPDLELMLFARETQNVPYREPNNQPGVFHTTAPPTVNLLFENGKWYRLAYRRELEYDCPKQGPHMAEFIFLEHPDLPGAAIGFRRETFFTHA